MTARVRTYNFDNQMPATTIPDYVSYDDGVSTSHTNGPFVYSHARGTITADATWTGLKPVALGVGYARNHSGYVHRIYADTDEDVFTLTADAVALPWGSVRAQAEFSDRTGSELGRSLARADWRTAEAQTLRRRQPAAQQVQRTARPVPVSDVWNLSVNAGVGNDDYDDSYFGLQESSFRVAGLAFDVAAPERTRRRRQLQL